MRKAVLLSCLLALVSFIAVSQASPVDALLAVERRLDMAREQFETLHDDDPEPAGRDAEWKDKVSVACKLAWLERVVVLKRCAAFVKMMTLDNFATVDGTSEWCGNACKQNIKDFGTVVPTACLKNSTDKAIILANKAFENVTDVDPAIVDVPCKQVGTDYCFPKFLAVTKAFAHHTLKSQADMATACNDCVTAMLTDINRLGKKPVPEVEHEDEDKHVSRAPAPGIKTQAMQLFHYADADIVDATMGAGTYCLKDGDKYCFPEGEQLAAAIANTTTEAGITELAGKLCSSRCFQKYGSALVALYPPTTAWGKKARELQAKVNAICSAGPKAQSCAQPLLNFLNKANIKAWAEAGCNVTSSMCSTACAQRIKQQTDKAGCCLKAVFDNDFTVDTDVRDLKTYVLTTCAVTVEPACAKGAVRKVMGRLDIKNLLYSYVSTHVDIVTPKFKLDLMRLIGVADKQITKVTFTQTHNGDHPMSNGMNLLHVSDNGVTATYEVEANSANEASAIAADVNSAAKAESILLSNLDTLDASAAKSDSTLALTVDFTNTKAETENISGATGVAPAWSAVAALLVAVVAVYRF